MKKVMIIASVVVAAVVGCLVVICGKSFKVADFIDADYYE